MANLQSTLTIKLLDDVSGPAGKIAAALKNADSQVKALAKAGVSNRLAQQLGRLGASAADIEKVGAAWKKYAADQKLAAKAGDWTRAQASQVRVWENATISSIRNVTRAEEALARRQRELAQRGSMSPTGPKVAPPGARAEPWGPRPPKGPPIVPVPGDRRAARGLMAGYAGYRGVDFGRRAVVSAAEFDIGVRKQREFVDIPRDIQEKLLIPQAQRIGQQTQFTNLDVVRAQTKAMQGLPAAFDGKLRAEVGAAIVEQVKNYALVMEADLETSSEAIRTFLQTTNKDISTKEKAVAEATRATNLMVKMAKLGGMSDEDVQQYMKFGAASGTAAGLSDTTLAAIGAIGRRGGLRGDELGVFVRAISSKLVAPTSKGLDALTAAGINFNDFTKMPGGLSVANLESFQKRRFGKGFTDDQRERLAALLDNGDVVGSRDEFVKEVSAIVAESFDKTKGGKTKAQDAQKIAKMVGDFHKLSTESVDTEGLLNAIMTNPKMTIALLNALFTSQQGGRGEILAMKWAEFVANKRQLDQVSQDPEFAKKKADEIMGGLGGKLEQAKGSVENFILAIGQANEKLATLALTKFGDTLDAISNLPEPIRRVGTELTVLAAGIAALKGLEAFSGGFGLKASAAALDGSAAALNAAAARLGGGGGGVPGAPGGSKPGGSGVVPVPGPFGLISSLLIGKEALDYAFNNWLPKRGYPKGYDPAAEQGKSWWQRGADLYGRWRGTPRGGEGYGKDYTLGSDGKFNLGPSYVPPGGFKSTSAWTAGNVAPGPLGRDRGAMGDVWSSGAKAIQHLVQSSVAGAAGARTWTRSGELIDRWRGVPRGGEGYGKDYTLGSDSKFNLGPSYVPPGGLKSTSAWTAGNVAHGPLGRDRGAMGDVWSSGAKAIQHLDQSSVAGAAGARTAQSYKANVEAGLEGVDDVIRAAIARWTSMLGGWSASPSIKPKIEAPTGGAQRSSYDDTSRELGRRTQDALYRNFSDTEFG